MAAIIASLLTLVFGASLAGAAPAWVARHGLTGAEYQAEFDQWVGAGYRLTRVSGYSTDAGVRYAAIWKKIPGPAWQARHRLSAADFKATVHRLRQAGYRPVLVNGYGVGSTTRFAAIFHRTGSVPWRVRVNLTATQYQKQFDLWVGHGYRLRYVSGYALGGSARYAAIWEKSPGREFDARHGLSAPQLRATFDTLSKKGYRLAIINGYRVQGEKRYVTIFRRSPAGVSSVARYDLTPQQYQSEFDFWVQLGYRPRHVSAHASTGKERFAAIWERASTSPKPRAVVALGDSFMSGEAAGDYESGTNGPFNYCHRSRVAEIHAAQITGARSFNLACSGGSAANIISLERYGQGTSWVEAPRAPRFERSQGSSTWS